MTARLFGTDGVRGVAGSQLTAELAHALGAAAVAVAEPERPRVVIVRDTRESGPMLERALAEGIAAAGGEALLAGVLPTPAAAILVANHGLDLAVAVSASHNPWQDNGIKFFGADGRKIPDTLERRIEAIVAGDETARAPAAEGSIGELDSALGEYVDALATAFPQSLAGLHVVLDCAHGATHTAAPRIFARLGAEVEALADDPDGRNINEGCGSTAPAELAARVTASGAALGFAFDGDGDRVVAVDGDGRVRDGDELIALIAAELDRGGELGGGVAVTVMSNYGFHRAMGEAGIAVATTPVGDRHVGEALDERGWLLGGEQSGHLIYRPFAPTGDGIAAALLTIRALHGRPLAAAVPMSRLPQRLVNVRVADREAIDGATAVWDAVAAESEQLEGRGRVLLRPSGTEPLIRVMVEAPTQEECDAICARLVAVVERELG